MELRQLYKQGLRISEIAKRLNIDRKTARKYANSPKQPSYKKRPNLQPLLDPYKDYLKERLEKFDLSSERLFKEIKQQGYTGSYSWLCKYITKNKQNTYRKAVLRFETLPGEQAQVDWGYLGEIFDKKQNRRVKLYCFFMVLGYSRILYAEVFDNMRLRNFLLGHNNAFKSFGGYTREILYDNLKSVVIKRMFLAKDSEFNKKFIDFAGFYGFKPVLCRPYKPCTKGKVENSVNFVKQNFYCGREFSSIEEINEKLKNWLYEVSHRNHGTVHEKPVDRLLKENLIKLVNKDLYDLTPVNWRRVTRESFFSYEGNFYSVPYEYAGKEVSIKKITNSDLEVSYRQEVVAMHKQIKGTGNFVRNPDHFIGLLELRYKQYKPKNKPKKTDIFNPTIPIAYINEAVISHELSCYE